MKVMPRVTGVGGAGRLPRDGKTGHAVAIGGFHIEHVSALEIWEW